MDSENKFEPENSGNESSRVNKQTDETSEDSSKLSSTFDSSTGDDSANIENRSSSFQMVRQRARDRRLLATLFFDISSSDSETEDELFEPESSSDSDSDSETETEMELTSEYSDYKSASSLSSDDNHSNDNYDNINLSTAHLDNSTTGIDSVSDINHLDNTSETDD